jgi:hypothetical protein
MLGSGVRVSGLCLGESLLQSRPGYQVFWLMFFMGFFSSVKQASHSAKDRGRWWALVNAVMNLQVP